ncbi:MAG: ester cyclase [Chloroflexi bacterium]|nr:MAG: ester cyclase [Chloroflexota bacterium]
MTAKDNTTLVRKLYDAYNNHQSDPAWFDKAAAIIAEDFEGINPRGVSRGGSVGLNTHIGSWIIAFPGCNVEVTNVFSTKDQTVVEFIGRGTHTGPLPGPSGDIPPTGRKAEVRFCEVYRFKNGKIASIHTYYDALDLMRQLGVNSF